MATNLNYNVNVNTTNGVQALNNLQNKVQGLNSAFAGLKNAIAGIAVGQIISNVLRFGDAIKDLSDATGIATTDILGFQRAVSLFGGSTETAQKGILRLVGNIGEAAEGSASLQTAFSKVGVTLDDLGRLSETDILRKTIQGLERIQDPATQAALKAQLLGKEFRNVSMSGISETFARSAEESRKYAQSIEQAAKLQETLDRSLEKVKITLLQLIEPMAKFINSMEPNKLVEIVGRFTELAAVFASFAILGRIVVWVESLAVAFGVAGAAGIAMGVNILKNFTLIGKILSAIGIAAAALGVAFPEAAKKITDAFSSAYEGIKNFLGIKSPQFLDQKEVERENYLLSQRGKALKETGNAAREVRDPFEQLRKSLGSVAEEYARMNQLNIQQLNLQTSLIGKSREEAEVSKAKAELLRKEAEEIEKLQDKRSKLTKEQIDAGLGKVIDEQIAKIKEQTQVDMEGTEAAIRNSQERIRAYDLEKFARQSQIDVEKQIRDIQFEMATVTMSEMQKKAAQIRRDALERAEAEIKAQEAARGTLMTEAEKQKYYDAAIKKTDELIRANEELYNKSRTFSTGWKRAFQDYVDNATNAAKRAENIFRKATQGMEDLIVNFVKTGKFEWKNFVSMMLEELLRAQIQQIFAQLMGSMQGSITGAGGGGGFLDSILGGIGSIFGSEKGDGGFWDTISSGIGSLFGGGGGSGSGKSMNDPIYVYDVSGGGGFGGGGILGPGQEGGGIMGTIGKAWEGVKSAAGSVWEGIKSVGGSVISGIGNAVGGVWEGIKSVGSSVIDGIGSVVGGISDTIGGWFGGGGGGGDSGSWLGDIASGIGDFFGGWFANGGTLGAGKWGIAGENGPELISGPASVTPMSGTNVTYNINAVDAMSFKQLLAQDPSYIYALSLQGGKGVPARR